MEDNRLTIFIEQMTELYACLNSMPPNALISSFIPVGTNLFAATFDSGVFLSTNQGESWAAVNAGLTDLRVRTLAVADGTLFAGTLGSGVFVTDVTRKLEFQPGWR